MTDSIQTNGVTIETEEGVPGVTVTYDGESRYVAYVELVELATEDGPVEIR